MSSIPPSEMRYYASTHSDHSDHESANLHNDHESANAVLHKSEDCSAEEVNVTEEKHRINVLQKRRCAIASTKARFHQKNTSLPRPRTPDPEDFNLSKRAWESQFGMWRKQLRKLNEAVDDEEVYVFTPCSSTLRILERIRWQLKNIVPLSTTSSDTIESMSDTKINTSLMATVSLPTTSLDTNVSTSDLDFDTKMSLGLLTRLLEKPAPESASYTHMATVFPHGERMPISSWRSTDVFKTVHSVDKSSAPASDSASSIAGNGDKKETEFDTAPNAYIFSPTLRNPVFSLGEADAAKSGGSWKVILSLPAGCPELRGLHGGRNCSYGLQERHIDDKYVIGQNSFSQAFELYHLEAVRWKSPWPVPIYWWA